MDQQPRGSRLRHGSDVNDRKDERRAAVSKMMAENREGLGMKVIAVMVQRYGVLPRELWDLNSISDMGAGRGVTYNEDELSEAVYESISQNKRYNIVSLTIGRVYHRVHLPSTLRRLKIMAYIYSYPLQLPVSLEELDLECIHNQPLVLPDNLRKLVLNDHYDEPVIFPSRLVELKLGENYTSPLLLPLRLKRLDFARTSRFNLPVVLPDGLTSVLFGDAYSQPTILPHGIEAIRVGAFLAHDLSLPDTLRKIEWRCNRPIQVPEGVSDITFGGHFNKPCMFPGSLKKVAFLVRSYSHSLSFPDDLRELTWYPRQCEGLVLPSGLQKLIWSCSRSVSLPLGLRELVIERYAPFVLPDGLLKVTFACGSQRHYDLPASVREVRISLYSSVRLFAHPSTLAHLIVEYDKDNVDLSNHKIYKLTIAHRGVGITRWPRGLRELEFTVDFMIYPLRVPHGCRIVGKKRPTNVTQEEAASRSSPYSQR